MLRKYLFATAVLTICLLWIACTDTGERIYFEQLPPEGWSAQKPVAFTLDTIARTANYRLSVVLRGTAAEAYPYRSITLLVEQQWKPSGTYSRDTLVVQLYDGQGFPLASGTNYFERSATLPATLALSTESWGTVRLRHLMSDDHVEGFSHIGFTLSPIIEAQKQ